MVDHFTPTYFNYCCLVAICVKPGLHSVRRTYATEMRNRIYASHARRGVYTPRVDLGAYTQTSTQYRLRTISVR